MKARADGCSHIFAVFTRQEPRQYHDWSGGSLQQYVHDFEAPDANSGARIITSRLTLIRDDGKYKYTSRLHRWLGDKRARPWPREKHVEKTWKLNANKLTTSHRLTAIRVTRE